jgi:trans-aconitate methyltransferase
MLNETFWKALEDYDTEILGVFRDSQAAKPVTDYLQEYGRGSIVADLGCGPGQAFPYLTISRSIFAVDSSSDLLTQASQVADKQRLEQISFLEADLSTYQLPEQVDLSLMSASFFPNSFHHALRILGNIQCNTKPGGKLLAIIPSMESLLYWFHLIYRHNIEQGETEEDVYMESRDTYSRIMTYGYFHNPTGKAQGQVVKYWIEEELRDLLAGMRFKDISIEKHVFPWATYFPDRPHMKGHVPTWLWRVIMENQ